MVLVSTLLSGRNLIPIIYHPSDNRDCSRYLLRSWWKRHPFSSLFEYAIYHDRTAVWIYHKGGSSLGNPLHGSKCILTHVSCLFHRSISKSKRVELADWCCANGSNNRLWIFRLLTTMGLSSIWCCSNWYQPSKLKPTSWQVHRNPTIWRLFANRKNCD